MAEQKNELLEKDYIAYFDCDKLAKMIKIFISMIRGMELELGNVESIKITSSYEMKYSEFVKPSNSGIESFWINDYDTDQKLKECISMYTLAFNNLSLVEKEIFYKTFILKEKDNSLTLTTYYKIPLQRDITYIRKSAIVKFSNSLRFNRIMDSVL